MYIMLTLGLIATSILLPIISHPYTETAKDPDGIQAVIWFASFALFFFTVFIVPIPFIIWIIKSESKPDLSLK